MSKMKKQFSFIRLLTIRFLMLAASKAETGMEDNIMRKTFLIGILVLSFFHFSISQAVSQDKVVVIPLLGSATQATAPAAVEKTGQTTSYETGDDGDLQKGVAWPTPRFVDNANGTVTDNLTDLIWLQDANCVTFFSSDNTEQNSRSWNTALTATNSLANGYCGLSDGSNAGDWRLPDIKELQSLIDCGRHSPALPSNHPFTGVQNSSYWSSTTIAYSTTSSWYMNIGAGGMGSAGKGSTLRVWPVRGGY
jgi:hypothetical protein